MKAPGGGAPLPEAGVTDGVASAQHRTLVHRPGTGSAPHPPVRTATWLQKDGKGPVAPQCGAARVAACVRRGWSLFLLCTGLLLLQAGPASAKSSIAIIPFGRYPVERQLTQTLCAEVTCIPASQVMRQGHVDWDRVAAAHPTGVVLGKIGRDSRGKRFVDVQLVAPGHIVLVRKKAPLSNMALSSEGLRIMTSDLVGVLNRAHGPERPTPPPAADTTLAPAVVAGGTPAPGKPAAPAAPAAPTSPAAAAAPTTIQAVGEEVPAEAEGAGGEKKDVALLEVQVTFAFLNREYSYTSSSTGTPILRNTYVPLAAEPTLLVGLFPLRSSTGVFESLGLEGGVGVSVGMALQRENDASGTTFPAVALVANASLLTRLRLGKTVRLTPVVGWQMMDFDVAKATNGTVLTGQPGVHWRALRAGLKLDVDFSSWCALYLELSYLYVYSAGPLTASPYFTSSSAAPSFDTALGLSFRVAPPLEVRGGVVFTRYGLNFGTGGPAGLTGVSDQLIGFTLGIRYSY